MRSLRGVQLWFPKTDARIDTNAAGTLHISDGHPGFIRLTSNGCA